MENIYLTPVLIYISLGIIDFVSAVYVVNYLDIGIVELNPFHRNNDGTFNYTKGLFISLITISSITLFYAVMYTKAKKPMNFENPLKEVIVKYENFTIALVVVFSYAWFSFLVVFGWSLIVLILRTDFNLSYEKLSLISIFINGVFINGVIAFYWTLLYLLRYVEPNARKGFAFFCYLIN